MPKLHEPLEGGTGMFVQQGIIKEFELNENANDQFQKDFDYIMTVEVEGKEGETYDKKIFVSGKLYKDGSIPTNWTHLLLACGIMDNPDKDIIVDQFGTGQYSEELRDFFVGKSIKFLNYVSGTYEKDGQTRPSYRVWNGNGKGFNYKNTWDMNTSDADIVKEFEKKLTDTYAPKYTPNVIDELNNNSSSETDDDLPPASSDDDLL